ncbi:hypothetical protein Q0M94_11595 [Deinococcus radiomollis]|uniref:hypothetical protein n=1 Tax=Deinococcus radiomollis TaxID=468916 RepID=UPI00389263EE
MSFSVTVYANKPLSIDDLPSDIGIVDIMLDQEQKNALYDEPIAADGAFYRFWHTPAIKLDLPLVSKIYNFGFLARRCVKLTTWEGK